MAACICTRTPASRKCCSVRSATRHAPRRRARRRRRRAPAAAPAVPCSFEQFEHALHADAPADRRRGLAAELLDQAVVAAAAADRALRAEPVGDELEHGQVVVVQAAHQARVDACRPTPLASRIARRPSKCASEASPRKSISLRRRLDHGLHRRVLGVEDAQRIAVQAALGILVEQVGVLLEVRDQLRRDARALGRLAQAVEFEPHVASGRAPSRARCASRISSASTSGPGEAQRLGADLVELAVAAALRPLVAEHRPHVPEPLAAVVQQRCARSRRARRRPCSRGAASAASPLSLSSKEYISFSTMSVTSPMPRTNSAVCSTIGVRMLR